jgi:hypothetical protein
MGWNDRLPEDPFIPSAEYYQDREEYNAWLEYVEARLEEENAAQLSSQNINPADLKRKPQGTILSRAWRAVFGTTDVENKEAGQEVKQEVGDGEERYPF